MLRLGQTILLTKNIPKLTSFLCEIFDLEIDNSRDSVRLVNEDLSFLLIERADILHGHSDMFLDFFVDSPTQLLEIKEKFEFFKYKSENHQAAGDRTCAISNYTCEIKDIGPMQFIFIVDPDARRWKITYNNLNNA